MKKRWSEILTDCIKICRRTKRLDPSTVRSNDSRVNPALCGMMSKNLNFSGINVKLVFIRNQLRQRPNEVRLVSSITPGEKPVIVWDSCGN